MKRLGLLLPIFAILSISQGPAQAQRMRAANGDFGIASPKAKGQTPESLRVRDGSVLDESKKSGFVEKVKG